MAGSLTMHETTLSEVEETAEASALPMDEETFRAFYERTARSVWVYLSRITGDRQLADDLVQETYYRFFRAGATHESESHRRNSLYCIATNLGRDALRRGRHRNHSPLPEGDEEGAQALVAYGDVADRVEGRTDLARALAHLRPAQREMLWLAYALGSSHEEI
ncbi:MAG: sigM 2, partial [Acidobacteria bacterium]|nr:sigM 2 [Acidobacteriota bacterium]